MGKSYSKEQQLAKNELPDEERTSKLGVTADDVARAILAHFRKAAKSRGDVYPLAEVGLDRGRRIDLVLLSYYRNPVAFEIKTNRADWLSELRDHEKHVPAMDFTGSLYVAAPPGVVEEHELPDGVGLYVVQGLTGKVRLAVRAKVVSPSPVTWKDVAKMVAGSARAIERGIT